MTIPRIRHFHVEDTYFLNHLNKTAYVGHSPITFDRNKSVEAFAGPWRLDHPDWVGKLCKVKGVESHCLMVIRVGAPISLVVEEWRG